MQVLVVEDEKNIRDATVRILEAEGHYAEGMSSGRVALMRLREEPFDFALVDLRLGDEDGVQILKEIRQRFPRVTVALCTAFGTIESAVKAIQMGAFDYLEKPFTPDNLRGLLLRVEQHRRLQDKIGDLQAEISNQAPPPLFESLDPAMQQTFEVLFRAAKTSASILILGESGTGKSMVARAVHERSNLANKPFVTISCPSLSKELFESELFGHVKGSFTGAISDKWGKVRAAHGGTLFLDEIGELPLDIQPKLLRLLQEKEYERVGENTTRTAEVRVIAASNRNLKQLADEGKFREDLYYRLNVIAVTMPPLRSRPKDLLRFANDYLGFFSQQTGRRIRGFSPEAMTWLTAHPWPGNLRELRNAMERAVILTQSDEIQAGDLHSPTAEEPHNGNGSSSVMMPGSDLTTEQLEEEHIRLVLQRVSSLQKAAEILGIDQATLYRKRKKFGIN